MLDLVFFALLGLAIGVATGLVPGLHVNTLIPLLLASTTLIGNPYHLAVLIVAIAVTQIFVGYIPSIFLGAPEEGTALSVLPGHKILHEGRGYEAVKLTVIGGVLALAISIALIFSFSNYFSKFYAIVREYLSLLLAIIIIAMIVFEKNFKKMCFAATIILISGFLGFVVLNSGFANKTNVLFPLLSGMFGVSTILLSISEKAKIPPQIFDQKINLSKKKIVLSALLGSLAGITVGFLPAIGVSQAAAGMQLISGLSEPRAFLVTLSAINVANEIFSLNSLHLVGNPRSGASVAVERILGKITALDVLLFFGVISFVSGIAAVLTLILAKKIPMLLLKADYKKISIAIIIFVASLVFITVSWQGLLILATSTAIGLLCIRLNVRRTNCMGVLLLPTLFFFSGWNPLIISFLKL
jgi:putative membrane protein